jgi:hypothetical protein
MVQRHCTIPYQFACITENPIGINPNIKIISLPNHTLSGWWYKPWVFSKDFPLHGEIVFMDLDIVIIDNINFLWEYSPSSPFIIIKDFIKSSIPTWNKFNSSIYRFKTGVYHYVWDNLIKNINQIRNYRGDQEWLDDQIKNGFEYWPDDLIMSYKWEVRDRSELVRVGNILRFKTVSDITPSAPILVFHGDPKPDSILDKIIVNNWHI